MSRITGSEVKSLMEAYQSIYAPQELTEEQVWEEVEIWVNSLLEEGYDLSEYTWEDMYEAYLSEIPTDPTYRIQKAARAAREASGAKRALETGKTVGIAGGPFGTQSGVKANLDSAATRRTGRTVLRTSVANPAYGTAAQQGPDKIRLGGKDLFKAKLGGKDVYVGSPGAKPPKPEQPKPEQPKPEQPKPEQPKPEQPKPTPAAAKPAPAKPAPAAPATGMLGKTSFERRTPTSAELKAAQTARAGGANPEQALQAAKAAGTASKVQSAGQTAGAKAFSSPTSGASAFKPATVNAAPSTSPSASGSVAPATAAIAAKPSQPPVAPKATGSKKPGSTFEEYDAYDLVLEYLLSQGHVETVDEALYVMLEMDAEMIQSIVEGNI